MYVIAMKGMSGLREEVLQCYRNAQGLKAMLEDGGWPEVRLGELSTTVTFKSPTDAEVIRKWSLACEGGTSHVDVMPHCKWEQLEEFAKELLKSREREVQQVAVQPQPRPILSPLLVPCCIQLGDNSGHKNILLMEDDEQAGTCLSCGRAGEEDTLQNVPRTVVSVNTASTAC